MNLEMVRIQLRIKSRNNQEIKIGKIFLILHATNPLKVKAHKIELITILLTISRWVKSEVVFKKECFSMNQFTKQLDLSNSSWILDSRTSSIRHLKIQSCNPSVKRHNRQ